VALGQRPRVSRSPRPGVERRAGYGADQDGRPAFFVVTSRAPSSYRLAESHGFAFVLDGPAAAIDRARTAAGDRDVFVKGGGTLVGSCLRDGLLDELRLHVSPEVSGRARRCSSASDGTTQPDLGAGLTGLHRPDPPGGHRLNSRLNRRERAPDPDRGRR
jgi:RibD C-terminal domain